MEKVTSVLAAFEAGKLPSTQQFNQFIDWLNEVGIAKLEPTSSTDLSAQGRVLANDLRHVLEAYKTLGSNKNCPFFFLFVIHISHSSAADNILQQAVWHLTEGNLTITSEAESDKDKAIADLNAIRSSIRSLLSVIWSSVSSEGTSVFEELLSVIRLSLADAAQLIEEQAGLTKKRLRSVESEVQGGTRDSLGRDKKRLEEEKDPKVAWQHGMDTVKDAGTTVIGTAQEASASARDTADKTSSRLQKAFYKVCHYALQSNIVPYISSRLAIGPNPTPSTVNPWTTCLTSSKSASTAASTPPLTPKPPFPILLPILPPSNTPRKLLASSVLSSRGSQTLLSNLWSRRLVSALTRS